MELHISKTVEELSHALADWMVENIQKTLKQQDRFTLALSGGSTPVLLHKLLASDAYKNKIDWSKVHIFFGDERFVPFNDERNNAKMAYDTLLNHVPVPKDQIHIMQTDNISPEDSAIAYEKILHQYFDGSRYTFDLILLGMGDDGHTLSLFPGNKAVIFEQEKWCLSLWLEAQKMYRVTLTHPVANNSAQIVFLTAGNNKAKALKEVLYGDYDAETYPAQTIHATKGKLHWFIDEAAASLLE